MVRSGNFELSFIATAGIWTTLLAIGLYYALGLPEVSPFYWLILVVGVDVSHVYSTTFRTYFNFKRNPKLKKVLIFVPLVSFLSAFLVASYSAQLFWTALVYIAVFHFSRQQIGFLRIYTDIKDRKKLTHGLNEVFIYIFTLGTILVWHLEGHKSFNWFTPNDFYYLQDFSYLAKPLRESIVVCFVTCLIFNGVNLLKKKISNYGFLIILSTFISWYFPIVYYNSDFIFTMANILSHGLPYMALVWAYEKKQATIFSTLKVFLPLLLLAAFIEEALWDCFIWREHPGIFESFYFLPQIKENWFFMAFTLALLICPQLTHYVLDGFIWKKKYLEQNVT